MQPNFKCIELFNYLFQVSVESIFGNGGPESIRSI